MPSQPIIIVLIGLTGSGKTNFINKLTGVKEDRAAHQLEPHTQTVREFTVNSKGQQYVFVDTPGLDNTRRSDDDILHTILEWLGSRYRADVELSGIIYTYRITDNWVSGSACRSFDILIGLCERGAAGSVWLVTTMWDEVKNREDAESTVLQLEQNFWKPLINAGAHHKQFEENSSRCAWEIVEDLKKEGEPLLLRELVAMIVKLNEEQKETITRLWEEAKAQGDPELMKRLKEERRRLEVELQKTPSETKKPKMPLFRRIKPQAPTRRLLLV